MPRDNSGNFTLVAGNPVVTGTTIDSNWANSTLTDIAAEMTDSLSRDGEGGMLQPLLIVDGTVNIPSLAATNHNKTGFYWPGSNELRVAVNNSDVQRWLDGSTEVWDGANWQLLRDETNTHFAGDDPSIGTSTAALTVGGADLTGTHLEFGPTAIQSKFGESDFDSISINAFGGDVRLGDSGTAGEPSIVMTGGDTLLLAGSTIVLGESLSTSLIIINSVEIEISHGDGADVLKTESLANGGIFVNNTLTGTGYERALTESDLAPPPVAGFVATRNRYMQEDGGLSGFINITTQLAQDVSTSVGATGSGATVIWTALDTLPSNAKSIIVKVEGQMNRNNAVVATMNASFNSEPVFGGGGQAASSYEVALTSIASANTLISTTEEMELILTPGGISTLMVWHETNTDARTIALYLRGFTA